MSTEFDRHAASYAEIINRGAALTGETFEHFIGVRLDLVLERLGVRAGDDRGLRVLDFGCGIGATERVLREKLPGAVIDGVDPSAESIRVARGLALTGVTFHLVTPGPLPFDDASFDLVYSNGTFHHIDHALHAGIFAELFRVVRGGGLVVLFENNPLNPLMLREMRRSPLDVDASTVFPWSLRRRLREAGFLVEPPRFYAFFPKQLKRLRWSERYLRRLPLGAQYFVAATRRE